MDELEIQAENKPKRDEKGRLLPGNTANPNGRPRGKTLKEYQAEVFKSWTDEQKANFLEDISKDIKWRMAEGNPHQSSEMEVKGSLILQFDKDFQRDVETPPKAE